MFTLSANWLTHHFASEEGAGAGWMGCSHCSLGDAGAADAEPRACIATGKQHNKAAGPLGMLLELLLSWEQHEEAEVVCNLSAR